MKKLKTAQSAAGATRRAKIVTKESMAAMLRRKGDQQVEIVGNALVALFNRQKTDERKSDHTTHFNYEGFTPADAKRGSAAARYFIRHHTLMPEMLKFWIQKVQPARSPIAYPRIARYSRQLNETAYRDKKVREVLVQQ